MLTPTFWVLETSTFQRGKKHILTSGENVILLWCNWLRVTQHRA